jgi:hypothetical protein
LTTVHVHQACLGGRVPLQYPQTVGTTPLALRIN